MSSEHKSVKEVFRFDGNELFFAGMDVTLRSIFEWRLDGQVLKDYANEHPAIKDLWQLDSVPGALLDAWPLFEKGSFQSFEDAY